ncbi:MAG: HAMP domain-containing protein [Clostridia bacterium]|nr:HAMP domain-containing protein [Clostridia bacterium]
MRFRLKIALCVSVLLAFTFSLGATLIISISFRTALEEQRRIADENYSFLAHTLVSVSKNPQNLQIPEIEAFFSLLESGENRNYAAVQVEIGDYLIYESAGSYPFRAIPTYHDLRAVEIFSSDDETVYMQISSNIVTHTTTYRMSILYDISAPYTAREEMLAIYRLVFCVILILGVAVSLLLGHVLARPLVSLSEASRRINAGELSCRAQRMSGDEVGDLAEDFNAMADRLEGQIHDLEDAVARQERFTASFAHEMRTPMTSIIGYAELLRAGDLPEGDAETALGFINSGANACSPFPPVFWSCWCCAARRSGLNAWILPSFCRRWRPPLPR